MPLKLKMTVSPTGIVCLAMARQRFSMCCAPSVAPSALSFRGRHFLISISITHNLTDSGEIVNNYFFFSFRQGTIHGKLESGPRADELRYRFSSGRRLRQFYAAVVTVQFHDPVEIHERAKHLLKTFAIAEPNAPALALFNYRKMPLFRVR